MFTQYVLSAWEFCVAVLLPTSLLAHWLAHLHTHSLCLAVILCLITQRFSTATTKAHLWIKFCVVSVHFKIYLSWSHVNVSMPYDSKFFYIWSAVNYRVMLYICILFTLWHGHQVGLLTILVEWLYAHSINPLDLLVILKQWSEHNLIFRGYLNFEFSLYVHRYSYFWLCFTEPFFLNIYFISISVYLSFEEQE